MRIHLVNNLVAVGAVVHCGVLAELCALVHISTLFVAAKQAERLAMTELRNNTKKLLPRGRSAAASSPGAPLLSA